MRVPEKVIFFLSLLSSKLFNAFTNPQKVSPKRILIIKIDELGDMVNSVHVFQLLENRYPTAEITVWCKPFCKPLIENDPHLTAVVTSAAQLHGRYDVIVDLRGTLHSIWVAFKNFPSYRVDRGTIRLRNKIAGGHPHEVVTNYQIIAPLVGPLQQPLVLQLYPSVQQRERAQAFADKKALQHFAVLHVGARRALRRWSAPRFAALANYLKQQKNMDIVFAGDASDLPLIAQVQALLSFNTVVAAAELNLMEFAALLSAAELFVGNESGPLHIAAAMQTPTVGLYGPGEPITFYPYGPKSRYVHHVLACNPCDQIHCVHADNPCIERITLAEVIVQITDLGL